MCIQERIKNSGMSIYKLAKLSNTPYATCNDIISGKTQLEKCSAETIYRLAKALNISMEELINPYMIKRGSFENFKSAICHRLKEKGDLDFLIDVLESKDIRTYFYRKWYPECLYLLAMLDYISRENNIPVCQDYDDLRKCKLEEPIFPAGILAMSRVSKNEAILSDAWEKSIPEFKRFNIVENEVRNVI